MFKRPWFRLSSSVDCSGHRRDSGRARSTLLLCLAASAALLGAASAGTLAFSHADQTGAAVQASAPSADSSISTPTLEPTADPTFWPNAAPASPSLMVSPTPTVSPTAGQATPARTAAPIRRNGLAIKALGISAPIKAMTTCGGTIPNGIYRWPCAGHNNLYLLGHAAGVFAPLHNAYHKGSLKPGMIALYTDGAGKVHRYRLQWVQDLPLATWGQGASWAATPGPVITLQTCDGATSNYRIIVRFVPA
jgi:hypothetical protein